MQNGIVDANFRLRVIPDEIPNLTEHSLKAMQRHLRSPIDVSPDVHISHDHLILNLYGILKPFSCAVFLRGSKAAELIDPIEIFCKRLGLSTAEIPKLRAHDTDWYCRLDHDRIPTQSLKETIPNIFPKETIHLQITVPSKSSLIKTAPPVVLVSSGVKQKADLAIGFLKFPYLFLRDAFAIHVDGTIEPSSYFWQAITDHALGIVRLEKRHELDFYAWIAALEQKAKGCLIVEEETTLKNILKAFPNLSSYELDRAIKKRIRDHHIEPLSFFICVLEEISKDRPELAEDVWKNCISFIKDLPQERHHALSLELLRHAARLTFSTMHATLVKSPQELRAFYPYIPSALFKDAVADPKLLQVFTVKVLLMHLKQYHPSPLKPYPSETLLTLLDLFIEDQLHSQQKKEVQALLNINDAYELVPIELLKDLLKTPKRLEPFSLNPLILFQKCPAALQMELMISPSWQYFFITHLSSKQFLERISTFPAKDLLSLINIPMYTDHLRQYLRNIYSSLVEKLTQYNLPLQSQLLSAYIKYLLSNPEQGIEALSGDAFHECIRAKGFPTAVTACSKELLLLATPTFSFIPLLTAYQTNGISIPLEVLSIPMPLDHSIALCLTLPNQQIGAPLNTCFNHPLLDKTQVEKLLPILIQTPALLNELKIDLIKLTELKLKVSCQLLHQEGREAEAIRLAIEIQQAPNTVPTVQFFQFAEDLLDLLSTKPYPDEAPLADALNLINVHFRACDMVYRTQIAKRMQLSNHPHIKACGLLWHLRIIEANGVPYSAVEVIRLFDGLSTLEEPQRTLFRKDLADCKLLNYQWEDPQVLYRIYRLCKDEFCSHIRMNAPKSAIQTLISFINLQGANFFKSQAITNKLFRTLIYASVELYMKEDFRNLLNLMYVTLSGIALNGRPFPKSAFDPCDLYFKLRISMNDSLNQQCDRLSIKFLTSLFVVYIERIRLNPHLAVFCFQIYYRFLKLYFLHKPTSIIGSLIFQYLSWLFHEDQFLDPSTVTKCAKKLVALGNELQLFNPEELTLYQLLTLQEPSTNAKNEPGMINQITILETTNTANPESQFLRLTYLLHFLISKGSPPAKDIAATYLYDQINRLTLIASVHEFDSFSKIYLKMKESVEMLIKLRKKVPKPTLISLSYLNAKHVKSLPTKS